MTLNKFKGDTFSQTQEAATFASLIVQRTEGAKIFTPEVKNDNVKPALKAVAGKTGV